MASPVSQGADLDTLARVVDRVRGNIKRVIEGKPDVITSALTVLLAEGHLLIEDVPGVGKTMLSKALARSIDCSVRRIQFTPDLLPSDVTGVSVFNQNTREFEFRPGGVFANIVVGDEINRASPKTQSALLECMEERQVTVDNTTYFLEPPFMVIATQNPIEMEGTYALPEAQRDRFMVRVSVGYPVEAAEIAMLDSHTMANPLDDLEPVTDAAEIRKLIGIVNQVHVSAGGAALRRRAHRGHPSYLRAVAGRLAARHAPPGPGREGVGRDRRAATTCCPTTCSGSPRRCSPTGCCRASRPRWAAATTASILDGIVAVRCPVPEGTPCVRPWPG